MIFITHNKVRMHDTDMAGILYFAKQFRFSHDALEDLVENEGYSFDDLFKKLHFIFVIVHCEANYFHPFKLGDELETHVYIEKIGNASFTVSYKFFNKKDMVLMGNAKTVHCTLNADTRKKINIPVELMSFLEKYHHPQDGLNEGN